MISLRIENLHMEKDFLFFFLISTIRNHTNFVEKINANTIVIFLPLSTKINQTSKDKYVNNLQSNDTNDTIHFDTKWPILAVTH